MTISTSRGVVQSSPRRQPRIAWKWGLTWTSRSFPEQDRRIWSVLRIDSSGMFFSPTNHLTRRFRQFPASRRQSEALRALSNRTISSIMAS